MFKRQRNEERCSERSTMHLRYLVLESHGEARGLRTLSRGVFGQLGFCTSQVQFRFDELRLFAVPSPHITAPVTKSSQMPSRFGIASLPGPDSGLQIVGGSAAAARYQKSGRKRVHRQARNSDAALDSSTLTPELSRINVGRESWF